MASSSKWAEKLQRLGTGGRICLLSAVLLLSGLVLIGLGVAIFGSSIVTGIVALFVCLVSAVVAHLGGEYPRGEFNFAARLAIQMVVRTVPPFGVALWGIKFAEPPLETSLVFYILSFYLIGLVLDVQLHLVRLKAETIQAEQAKG